MKRHITRLLATVGLLAIITASTMIDNPPDLQTVTDVGSVTDNEMTINSNLIVNGRIGVNTNSPAEALHVLGDAIFERVPGGDTNVNVTIRNLSPMGNAQITLIGTNTQHGEIVFALDTPFEQTRGLINYRFTDDSLTIQTAQTNRFRIDEQGRVAIGTNLPAERLDIQQGGKLRFNGGGVTNLVSTNSIVFSDGSILDVSPGGTNIQYRDASGQLSILSSTNAEIRFAAFGNTDTLPTNGLNQPVFSPEFQQDVTVIGIRAKTETTEPVVGNFIYQFMTNNLQSFTVFQGGVIISNVFTDITLSVPITNQTSIGFVATNVSAGATGLWWSIRWKFGQ